MWIYVLAYHSPFPVPPAFERYMENLEGRRVLQEVWIVRGNLSAHALVASTRAFLGDDAKIFVTEANEDYALHGIPNDLHRRRIPGRSSSSEPF
jgi:hypothetical protein